MSMSKFSFGLIGYPLGHSLSPEIHQAALAAAGLSGEYRLYPVVPGAAGQVEINRLLSEMRAGKIHGLNVTIPHKQGIIAYLDRLSASAQAIGAVNTIVAQGNELVGENTDADGFLADLWQRLDIGLSAHSRINALVLGAGGAARAVVYALARYGGDVWVAARRLEQAEQLVRTIRAVEVADRNHALSKIRLTGLSLQPDILRRIPDLNLIVNATSVGMTPDLLSSPWPDSFPLPQGVKIYDLVYNPTQTQFVQSALCQGLPAVNGLGMLVEQAALAFEKWTAHRPSRPAMSRAASRALITIQHSGVI